MIDAYFSASKIRWILENVAGCEAKSAGRGAALRECRYVADLAADQRGGACDGLFQRIANHADASGVGRVGRRSCWTFSKCRARCCRRLCRRARWWALRRRSIWAWRSRSRESRGISRRRLFGQACFRPGLSKNTYGTGCFALMHTGGAASGIEEQAAGDARGVDGRCGVRDRRERLHRGRRDSMAARQAGDYRDARRRAGNWRIGAAARAASISCRRSLDWARRTGIRTRAEC